MYFLFLVFALINSAFANSFTFIGQVPYNGITVNLTDVFLRAVKDVARYKNKIALCKCHSISDLLSVDDEKFLYNINREILENYATKMLRLKINLKEKIIQYDFISFVMRCNTVHIEKKIGEVEYEDLKEAKRFNDIREKEQAKLAEIRNTGNTGDIFEEAMPGCVGTEFWTKEERECFVIFTIQDNIMRRIYCDNNYKKAKYNNNIEICLFNIYLSLDNEEDMYKDIRVRMKESKTQGIEKLREKIKLAEEDIKVRNEILQNMIDEEQRQRFLDDIEAVKQRIKLYEGRLMPGQLKRRLFAPLSNNCDYDVIRFGRSEKYYQKLKSNNIDGIYKNGMLNMTRYKIKTACGFVFCVSMYGDGECEVNICRSKGGQRGICRQKYECITFEELLIEYLQGEMNEYRQGEEYLYSRSEFISQYFIGRVLNIMERYKLNKDNDVIKCLLLCDVAYAIQRCEHYHAIAKNINVGEDEIKEACSTIISVYGPLQNVPDLVSAVSLIRVVVDISYWNNWWF